MKNQVKILTINSLIYFSPNAYVFIWTCGAKLPITMLLWSPLVFLSYIAQTFFRIRGCSYTSLF